MRRIPRSAILGAAILVAILVSAGCTKEAPQTGSLQVTSTPAGLEVQVILDGNFKGMTPLLLSNLSAGSHLVQLRSPGYAERVQLVTVNAGQKMTIAADYPPIPASAPVTPIPLPTAEPTTLPTVKITEVPETPLPPGAIYVTSFPSGATIYLDGRGYGTTPRLIPNLTPGSYELRLSLVGWKDYKVVVSVSPGQTHREDGILRS